MGVRRRAELPHRSSPQELSLPGHVCIVTGASGGMGAEVAWGLAEAGASRVLMACRNLERCEQARAKMFSRCVSSLDGPGASVTERSAASFRAARRRQCQELQRRLECKTLDLTDYESIEAFAKDSASSGAQQIVLVNNAGVMGDVEDSENTGDELVDMQMRTNHYGHFLLAKLLLPSMDSSSILVVVASRAHRQGSLTITTRDPGLLLRSEEIQGSPPYARLLHALGLGWYARYARSKLCNVLFAAEVRRRYPDGPISVAVSPGLVNTGIFASVPEPLGKALCWCAERLFQTPQEGAGHILAAIAAARAAQTQSVQSAKGEDSSGLRELPLYWHCGEAQEPSKAALDAGLAEALWRASEEAVTR
ncbi:RDH14 [Symbiodinium necroappetens]|uniref:RDH14 protein n=1 Tax=Symbiodinium necroappetens TaxID=1628268 RepID=A0A812SPF7_9DINO|nr:RDH14 [Symbiodinium necroappetens]